MEYKTKRGFVLTDEMIEEMAEQAERGIYPGSLAKWSSPLKDVLPCATRSW